MALAAAPPAARHDTHLSHARMVVEGRTVTCRIRLFRDDLEAGLRRMAGDSAVRVGAAQRQDALVSRYLAERLRVVAGGQALAGELLASGVEVDQARQEVAWYILQYQAARPVTDLAIRNTVLFEVFPATQQNIVQVVRLPAEDRVTLYFAPGDSVAQRAF